MTHLTEAEVKTLVLTSYQHIVHGVLDCFYLDQADFTFEISSDAQKILQSDTGVSVATLHMGCHEAVPFALQKITQRSCTLSKIPKNLNFAKEIYANMGMQCVDKNQSGSFLQLLNAIRQKKVVCLHSDHFAKDTEVCFFKRLTGAPCGAAMLSAYGQVPMLISYSVLQRNGSYKVYLDTVFDKPVSQNKEALSAAMATVYQRFEKIILQYPEHWYWSYKRWR